MTEREHRFNDRELVHLKREAVRHWLRKLRPLSEALENEIRRLFPLPPEKVPNVVRWGTIEFRQSPDTGRLEFRPNRRPDCGWELWWGDPENEAAIRAVIAEPYRLVSGEETE